MNFIARLLAICPTLLYRGNKAIVDTIIATQAWFSSLHGCNSFEYSFIQSNANNPKSEERGSVGERLKESAILQLNRNGRVPKRPNHGARPCSSVMRRLRVKESYKRWKPSLPSDLEQYDNRYEDMDSFRSGTEEVVATPTKDKPTEGAPGGEGAPAADAPAAGGQDAKK